MQISTLDKPVKLNAYVKLELDDTLAQETANKLLKAYPIKAKSNDQHTFERLIDHHFSSLNDGNYEKAWSDLSPDFQKNFVDPAAYGEIWKKYSNTQLLNLVVINKTPDRAYLAIEINHSLIDIGTAQIDLAFDHKTSRWLINQVHINSNENRL